jgi:acyl-CoA synthetase (NDP forming)/RimJ/RimL family protein N-acetyltransferase
VNRPYPAHWEADVVLRDGGTAHLRPIVPDDADALRAFHSRLSAETIYFRFFAPYPQLSDRDVARFTTVDYVDRGAIIATVGGEIIGVVRYERSGDHEAEVAFIIEDAHQGRGLGSVLLEHIAAAAQENGITRFVAEVLPTNRKMLNVFRDAGYEVSRGFDDGVVSLSFDLAPTETSLAVMQSREHRSEARSIQRLLRPSSVVVVGAGRTPNSLGRLVLANLVAAGFPGTLSVVNRTGTAVDGIAGYVRVIDVPGPVELVVVAVPADGVEAVVADSARKGAHGLVVLSAGFGETGEEGRQRQRRLVQHARANGMRVVGPNSFGLVNTHPEVRLNASISPVLPGTGRVGFFAQSGALGIAILESAARRGLGLSTFVSAGNRADVSGNDLLQFWEDDPETDAVLLYLESIGNPRKFSRLARRIGRRKPIVAVKAGRSTQGVPLGHSVRESRAPYEAVDAMFRQAGVLRVDTIAQLFDVAQVLTSQPLPSGPRVAVLGNSTALGLLAADACRENGLVVVGEPVALPAEASADEFAVVLAAVFDDPAVDSVVAVFIPPLVTPDEDVAAVLASAAARATKTVVATFTGMRGVPGALGGTPGALPGEVPAYPTPEEAVRALAATTEYAEWRRRPPGEVPELDVDVETARAVVAPALDAAPDGVLLSPAATAALLACYGIDVAPAIDVSSADEAVAAADRLGYPVVLKSTLPRLRHRPDLGGVRLGLGDADAVRSSYATVTALHPDTADRFLVQRMAPAGVAVVIGAVEDPLFGPIVSFGVGGVATELLGDRAYRIPPLTDREAADMVRSIKAAPLLYGWRGSQPVDLGAIEQLLLRVARLADDFPEVAECELDPILAAPEGVTVLGATVRLARPATLLDRGVRRLPG